MRLASPPDRELNPILVSYVAGVILRTGATIERAFGFDPAAAARRVCVKLLCYLTAGKI